MNCGKYAHIAIDLGTKNGGTMTLSGIHADDVQVNLDRLRLIYPDMKPTEISLPEPEKKVAPLKQKYIILEFAEKEAESKLPKKLSKKQLKEIEDLKRIAEEKKALLSKSQRAFGKAYDLQSSIRILRNDLPRDFFYNPRVLNRLKYSLGENGELMKAFKDAFERTQPDFKDWVNLYKNFNKAGLINHDRPEKGAGGIIPEKARMLQIPNIKTLEKNVEDGRSGSRIRQAYSSIMSHKIYDKRQDILEATRRLLKNESFVKSVNLGDLFDYAADEYYADKKKTNLLTQTTKLLTNPLIEKRIKSEPHPFNGYAMKMMKSFGRNNDTDSTLNLLLEQNLLSRDVQQTIAFHLAESHSSSISPSHKMLAKVVVDNAKHIQKKLKIDVTQKFGESLIEGMGD